MKKWLVTIGCFLIAAAFPASAPASEAPEAAAASGAAATGASAEVLTLEEAVQEATANNAEIQAARRQAEAVAARVGQAKALDDPEIGVMFEDVPIDTANVRRGEEINYSIQQSIPFPGKRHTRGKAARYEAKAAAEGARERELAVLSDLKRTYYELYQIDRSTAVNRELAGLFRQFAGSNETAYAAGKTTAEPALKARVELSKIENELTRLEQERTMHEAHLNALMGRDVHQPIDLPEEIRIPSLKRTKGEVEEIARERRPELKGAEFMAQSSRSKLTAARQGLLPDFTLGFEYNQRPNTIDAWTGKAMINLPIWFWGKNRAQIREAKAGKLAAEAEARSMEIHTGHDVAAGTSNVESAERIVRRYEKKILPEAHANLEAARLAYGAGKAEFMTLVDAARTYRELKLDYYRSLAGLGQAVADLEKIAGGDL